MFYHKYWKKVSYRGKVSYNKYYPIYITGIEKKNFLIACKISANEP